MDPELPTKQKSGVFLVASITTTDLCNSPIGRMPPRKKIKGATPAPDVDENAMATDASEAASMMKSDLLNDPWTDEQETSLFKGIIKWKPAGSDHFSDSRTLLTGLWVFTSTFA